MVQVILISILISLPAWAHPLRNHPFPKAPVITKVTIDGISESFITSSDNRIMISAFCMLGKNLRCEAASALARAFEKGLDLENQGGKNPGSLACSLLQGEVLIVADENGNQNTFCRFKDHSILDCGTLTYFTKNLSP